MKFYKRAYCRIYQSIFRLLLPFLPYREPSIYHSQDDLIDLLKIKKITSIMLITDKGIRGSGLTSKLENLLKDNNISLVVYDKTNANPTVENVEEARSLYLENNCQGLIAFGGGSAMDCAKATGARIAYPKKSLYQLKGVLKVIRKIPLLIAIPTTAGTGSEVTLAAVISDHQKHHKYTLMDFTLIPRYAVLDPSVTYSLPPHLTSTTGMDALTHAVEAFIGRSTTKETRKKALEATALIFNNIEKAYKNGEDYEARNNMLKAAYLAGIAFSKSYVGYIHAIAHSLGGQYNVPHGLANSVIMPYVLEAYGDKISKKLHKLAISAGISKKEDDINESAKRFIQEIKKLNQNMNIPTHIKGIKKEDIKEMARKADKEANPLYPVPKLLNANELEKFYYQLMEGEQ